MDVDASMFPLLSRRAIEAEILAKVYASGVERMGREAALALLDAAIDEAAIAAGREFASKAPGGEPSLAHFAKVLDIWQMGGALKIADIRQGAATLDFTVTRCGYVEMYTILGIPAELHPTLSCRRDASFAAGYSSRLTMHRPETIATGAQHCVFSFRWT